MYSEQHCFPWLYYNNNNNIIIIIMVIIMVIIIIILVFDVCWERALVGGGMW